MLSIPDVLLFFRCVIASYSIIVLVCHLICSHLIKDVLIDIQIAVVKSPVQYSTHHSSIADFSVRRTLLLF